METGEYEFVLIKISQRKYCIGELDTDGDNKVIVKWNPEPAYLENYRSYSIITQKLDYKIAIEILYCLRQGTPLGDLDQWLLKGD